MKTFKVAFDNGDYLVTKFNGTLEHAKHYYIDVVFEFSYGKAKGVSVEEIK